MRRKKVVKNITKTLCFLISLNTVLTEKYDPLDIKVVLGVAEDFNTVTNKNITIKNERAFADLLTTCALLADLFMVALEKSTFKGSVIWPGITEIVDATLDDVFEFKGGKRKR